MNLDELVALGMESNTYADHGNSISFKIGDAVYYIPKDADESTTVNVFFSGSRTSNTVLDKYYASGQAGNQIIVRIPCSSAGLVATDIANNSINFVENCTGCKYNNVNFLGWSKAANTAVSDIVNNKLGGRKVGVYVSIVGNPFNGNAESGWQNTNTFIRDNIDEFPENTNVLIVGDTTTPALKDHDTQALIDKGINLMLMQTTSEFDKSHSNLHADINTATINDGLMELMAGVSTRILDSGDFVFKVYDYNIGDWREANDSEVIQFVCDSYIPDTSFMNKKGDYKEIDSSVPKSYASLRDLKKIDITDGVATDYKTVANFYNDVVGNVSSSSFLNGYKVQQFSGGASIPSCVPLYINEFYSNVGQLVTKIYQEAGSILSVANASADMDEDLAKTAEDVLNTNGLNAETAGKEVPAEDFGKDDKQDKKDNDDKYKPRKSGGGSKASSPTTLGMLVMEKKNTNGSTTIINYDINDNIVSITYKYKKSDLSSEQLKQLYVNKYVDSIMEDSSGEYININLKSSLFENLTIDNVDEILEGWEVNNGMYI